MSITESEIRCATLLRDLRKRKGLTLEQFEVFSKGKVKAVVLGSYERGTRAISLARLEQLASLYEVPLNYFFQQDEFTSATETGRFIFDVRRVNRLEGIDQSLLNVRSFLRTIVNKRRDWNGEVISLRRSDSELLALLSGIDINELSSVMTLNGFLLVTNGENL